MKWVNLALAILFFVPTSLVLVSARKVGGVRTAERPKGLTGMAAALRGAGGVETQKKTDTVLPDPPKK